MKKKCLLVCLLCCLLFGLALAEEPMTETVLFEGSQPASGGWNLALTIDTTNVNGTFDPSLISENGYFAVTYDGVQNGVYLALSDWEGGVWAQINVPSTCTQTDGMYMAVFSFEQLPDGVWQHGFRSGRPNLRRHVRIHQDDGNSQGCVVRGGADGFAGRG